MVKLAEDQKPIWIHILKQALDLSGLPKTKTGYLIPADWPAELAKQALSIIVKAIIEVVSKPVIINKIEAKQLTFDTWECELSIPEPFNKVCGFTKYIAVFRFTESQGWKLSHGYMVR